MKSNVTRLKPRRGSYEEALGAFSTGDFSTCVDVLTEALDSESAILRSRAYVRLGDATAAVNSLDAHEFSNDSHEIVAEALAVKAYALQVLKRPLDASLICIEARARCFSAGLVGIEAELLFSTALGALVSGDFATVEDATNVILELVDETPSWVSPKTYAYSLNFWRARACDVRGAIEMLRMNYVGQEAWLRRAFDELDKSGVQDDYTYVSLLANYADTAITLGREEIIDFVIQRAEQIAWNTNLVANEFRVFSALAEASSTAGDQLSALRYFRRCLDCAPSPALQIRAGVERGRLLHEVGESFSAREELEHAVRLSRSVNWEETSPLDQRQLVFLAGQVAKYDGKQAEILLSRYDGLVSKNEVGFAIKDERFRGDEFMARAAVMNAIGRSDRAIMLLIDALETFSIAKFNGKAALVAFDLAELTGEQRYVDIARKQCMKQPQSLLANKMARFDKSDSQVEMVVGTPSQSPVVQRDRPRLVLLS